MNSEEKFNIVKQGKIANLTKAGKDMDRFLLNFEEAFKKNAYSYMHMLAEDSLPKIYDKGSSSDDDEKSNAEELANGPTARKKKKRKSVFCDVIDLMENSESEPETIKRSITDIPDIMPIPPISSLTNESKQEYIKMMAEVLEFRRDYRREAYRLEAQVTDLERFFINSDSLMQLVIKIPRNFNTHKIDFMVIHI